jgi:hypothetical protein
MSKMMLILKTVKLGNLIGSELKSNSGTIMAAEPSSSVQIRCHG